jgi:hypothetical protein
MVVQLVDCENEGEEGRGMWMVEDADWWFNLLIVRRNENKEEEYGWKRMKRGGSLLDCEKE